MPLYSLKFLDSGFLFWALSIKLIKRALDSSKIESEGGLVLDLLINIAGKLVLQEVGRSV